MTFIQAVLNGVLIGGVYALISTGLTLVFGVMEIVNFAQGEFLMIGMYVAYFAFVGLHIDPMVSAVFGFAVMFAIGVVIEAGLVRRILRGPPISQVFLTVGLSVALQNLALAVFGSDYRSVQVPYQTAALNILGLQFSVSYLLAFAWAAVVSVALFLFLSKTNFGRSMRAVSANAGAATLCGIHVSRVRTIAFGIGAGLAGLAGAVILPYAYVYPTIGTQYVLSMFTVAILGGLGNVNGALLGSMIVGITQSLSALYLPSALQNVVVFALFIIVMMVRPSGLLGRRSAS